MSDDRETERRDRISRADAGYRSFPEFATWASQPIDVAAWDAALTECEAERRLASTESLRRTVEFALRAAAIDTGAIEDLYQVDRGFTFSVAAQAATWESDLADKGEHVRRLFAAQLEGLELVVDAVTTRTEISEAWIRRLHEVICGAQETYRVRTAVGWQQQQLPKGAYKSHANHVELADGRVHSYCPVPRTTEEMHRLIGILASAEFATAHPVLQAAYAHYAFVAIHPFADGNGRVARALASIFTYRACSLPLVVFSDDKRRYLDALSAADAGRFDRFGLFVLEAMIDTVNEVVLRMRAARADSVRDSAERLTAVYARSAPAPGELDAVAARIARLVRDGLERELAAAPLPGALATEIVIDRLPVPANAREFRPVQDGSASVRATLRSSDPKTLVSYKYQVVVSSSLDAPYALQAEQSGAPDNLAGPLRVRFDLAYPSLKTALRRQLDSWVKIQASELLREATRRIEAATLRSARH